MSYIRVSEEIDAYELKERLWSGAEDVMQRIIDEDKEDTFFAILSDLHCGKDSMDLTKINDLLRFETEQVYEWCGINDKDLKEEFVTLTETDVNCLLLDEDVTDYLRKEIEESTPHVITTDLYSIEMEIGRDLTDDEVEELIRVGTWFIIYGMIK